MTHDIFQIDAAAAVAAAKSLGASIPTPSGGAARLRSARWQGCQLDDSSAVTLLDEIVEELDSLRIILSTRAELAVLADRFGGIEFVPAADLSGLLGRVDQFSVHLAQSLDDDVGTDAVSFAPEGDWTATEVRSWWLDLSDEERAQLTVTMSTSVGNVDGIPLGDRAAANRVTMQFLYDQVDHDPRLDQFFDPAAGTMDEGRQIVLFDPTSDGFAAELFGDLTTATSIAIVVPGMGSDLGNFTDRVVADARLIGRYDPTIAVIAWSGYDAPDGLPALSSTEVITDGKARAGGPQLAAFVGAVGLESSSRTTLIGHSYGSLTVGHSIQAGMTVDRVVFIGSPGVGVDHVDGFPDGAVGEFYAAEVHGDPVAMLERFGDAPTDPDFGATVFDAGNADSINPMGRHSEYFDDGTAIANLRTIVTGGTPSGDRPAVVDYIVEPIEDLHDGFNDAADFIENAPVFGPFIGPLPPGTRTVGNAAINTTQTVIELGGVYTEDVVVAGAGVVADGGRWVGGQFVEGLETIGGLPGELADALTPSIPGPWG